MNYLYKAIIITIISHTFSNTLQAQTDIDVNMMQKKELCAGVEYSYHSWNKYWEGDFKRPNLNLGTVSTQVYAAMGTYGVTNKLNIMAVVPFVSTKASAGQLKGLQGWQDVMIGAKYKLFQKKLKQHMLSSYVSAKFTTPTNNYVVDYLPLNIGLKATTITSRALVDYQIKKWFTTASAAYVWRSNIRLDRNSYYTTTMHYTNEVAMPNAFTYNIRAGYRNKGLIAEVFYNNWITQGGFDITKNNMPFPSNRMNNSMVGVHVFYPLWFQKKLSIVSNAYTTVTGRNVGQTNGFSIGLFYLANFTKK